MKAKLIRKRLFAGIICLGLTGNLFLYNVSAAEAGQDSSTAKSALENQSGSSGKEENGQEQTIPVSRRTQVNRTIPVSRIKTSRGRSRQQYPFPEKR